MNKTRILPDDPRLTAYALGELEAGELAEVEAAVRSDPEAQSAVAEIRMAAGRLSAALAGETAETAAKPRGDERTAGRRSRIGARRGLWLAYLSLGGLAAACLAALVVYQRTRPPVQPSEEPATGPARSNVAASLAGRVSGFAKAGPGYAAGVGGVASLRNNNYVPNGNFTLLANPAPDQGELKGGGVTIAIDKDGAIFLNGLRVRAEQLFPLLDHIHSVDANTPVRIEANESSQVKTLAFVMEACRRANLNKFSMRSR